MKKKVKEIAHSFPLKLCIDPNCGSNSKKDPKKRFFTVPMNPDTKKKWLDVLQVDVSQNVPMICHCCSDHFNLAQDLDNYDMVVSSNAFPSFKAGVLPRPHNSLAKNTTDPVTCQPEFKTAKKSAKSTAMSSANLHRIAPQDRKVKKADSNRRKQTLTIKPSLPVCTQTQSSTENRLTETANVQSNSQQPASKQTPPTKPDQEIKTVPKMCASPPLVAPNCEQTKAIPHKPTRKKPFLKFAKKEMKKGREKVNKISSNFSNIEALKSESKCEPEKNGSKCEALKSGSNCEPEESRSKCKPEKSKSKCEPEKRQLIKDIKIKTENLRKTRRLSETSEKSSKIKTLSSESEVVTCDQNELKKSVEQTPLNLPNSSSESMTIDVATEQSLSEQLLSEQPLLKLRKQAKRNNIETDTLMDIAPVSEQPAEKVRKLSENLVQRPQDMPENQTDLAVDTTPTLEFTVCEQPLKKIIKLSKVIAKSAPPNVSENDPDCEHLLYQQPLPKILSPSVLLSMKEKIEIDKKYQPEFSLETCVSGQHIPEPRQSKPISVHNESISVHKESISVQNVSKAVENIINPVSNQEETISKPTQNVSKVLQNVSKPSQNVSKVLQNVSKPSQSNTNSVQNNSKLLQHISMSLPNKLKPLENISPIKSVPVFSESSNKIAGLNKILKPPEVVNKSLPYVNIAPKCWPRPEQIGPTETCVNFSSDLQDVVKTQQNCYAAQKLFHVKGLNQNTIPTPNSTSNKYALPKFYLKLNPAKLIPVPKAAKPSQNVNPSSPALTIPSHVYDSCTVLTMKQETKSSTLQNLKQVDLTLENGHKFAQKLPRLNVPISEPKSNVPISEPKSNVPISEPKVQVKNQVVSQVKKLIYHNTTISTKGPEVTASRRPVLVNSQSPRFSITLKNSNTVPIMNTSVQNVPVTRQSRNSLGSQTISKLSSISSEITLIPVVNTSVHNVPVTRQSGNSLSSQTISKPSSISSEITLVPVVNVPVTRQYHNSLGSQTISKPSISSELTLVPVVNTSVHNVPVTIQSRNSLSLNTGKVKQAPGICKQSSDCSEITKRVLIQKHGYPAGTFTVSSVSTTPTVTSNKCNPKLHALNESQNCASKLERTSSAPSTASTKLSKEPQSVSNKNEDLQSVSLDTIVPENPKNVSRLTLSSVVNNNSFVIQKSHIEQILQRSTLQQCNSIQNVNTVLPVKENLAIISGDLTNNPKLLPVQVQSEISTDNSQSSNCNRQQTNSNLLTDKTENGLKHGNDNANGCKSLPNDAHELTANVKENLNSNVSVCQINNCASPINKICENKENSKVVPSSDEHLNVEDEQISILLHCLRGDDIVNELNSSIIETSKLETQKLEKESVPLNETIQNFNNINSKTEPNMGKDKHLQLCKKVDLSDPNQNSHLADVSTCEELKIDPSQNSTKIQENHICYSLKSESEKCPTAVNEDSNDSSSKLKNKLNVETCKVEIDEAKEVPKLLKHKTETCLKPENTSNQVSDDLCCDPENKLNFETCNIKPAAIDEEKQISKLMKHKTEDCIKPENASNPTSGQFCFENKLNCENSKIEPSHDEKQSSELLKCEATSTPENQNCNDVDFQNESRQNTGIAPSNIDKTKQSCENTGIAPSNVDKTKQSCENTGIAPSNIDKTKQSCENTGIAPSNIDKTKQSCENTGIAPSNIDKTKQSCENTGIAPSNIDQTKQSCENAGMAPSNIGQTKQSCENAEVAPSNVDKTKPSCENAEVAPSNIDKTRQPCENAEVAPSNIDKTRQPCENTEVAPSNIDKTNCETSSCDSDCSKQSSNDETKTDSNCGSSQDNDLFTNWNKFTLPSQQKGEFPFSAEELSERIPGIDWKSHYDFMKQLNQAGIFMVRISKKKTRHVCTQVSFKQKLKNSNDLLRLTPTGSPKVDNSPTGSPKVDGSPIVDDPQPVRKGVKRKYDEI